MYWKNQFFISIMYMDMYMYMYVDYILVVGWALQLAPLFLLFLIIESISLSAKSFCLSALETTLGGLIHCLFLNHDD